MVKAKVDLFITPLENEYPGNKHGIRSVLERWKRSINNLDKYGLPEPCFSKVGHSPYYGYPDVWDTSQVTDLTWTDGPDIKGLFEDENLQSLFIRQAKEFEVYYTEKDISRIVFNMPKGDIMKRKRTDGTYETFTYENPPDINSWATNWMTLLQDDVTHYNDGPVVNLDTRRGQGHPAVWVEETRNNVKKWKSLKRRLPRVFFIHMWDLSNVKNARRLFKNCIFNMEICNWNFDNVECIDEMFMNTKFFCTPIKFLREYELKNTFYDELIGTSTLGDLHKGKRIEDKNIQLPNWQIHLIKNIWNPLKKSLYVNVKESDTHTKRDKYVNTVIRGWNLLSNNSGGSSAKVLVGFFLYQNEWYATHMGVKAVDGELDKQDPKKKWTLQGMTYADEYTRNTVNHELHFKGHYNLYKYIYPVVKGQSGKWVGNKGKFGNWTQEWSEGGLNNAVKPISPDGDDNMKPKLRYSTYNQYAHIAELINEIKKDVTQGRWGWKMTEEEIKNDPNLKILDTSSNTGIKNFVIELTKYHIARIITHAGWRTRANNYPEEFMSVFRSGKTFEPRTTIGKTTERSTLAQGSQTYGYPFTAASQSFYGTLNIDQFKYKWTIENAYNEKETAFLGEIEDRNGEVAKQIARYEKKGRDTIPLHERGVYFINFQDIARWYFKNVIKHPKSIFTREPESNFRRNNNSFINRADIASNNYVIAPDGHKATPIRYGFLAYLNTSDGVKNELNECDHTYLKYIAGACSSLGVGKMPFYDTYKNKRSNIYKYLKKKHKRICGVRKSVNFVDFNENLEVRNLEYENLEDKNLEDKNLVDKNLEDEIIEDEEDEIIEDEEDEIIEDEEDEIIEDEEYKNLEDKDLEDENLEDEIIEDEDLEDEEGENLEDEDLEYENLEDENLEDGKEKSAEKEIVLLNTRNSNNEDDKEKNVENEIVLLNTRNADDEEDKNARDVDNILNTLFGDPDDEDAEKTLGRDESAGTIVGVFGAIGAASLSKTIQSKARYVTNLTLGKTLQRGNRAGNFARRMTGFKQVKPTKMKLVSSKFLKGAAVDFALWGAYEILENNKLTPQQTVAGAPPPPGNPFAVEDPRQLLDLKNMTPANVIRTLICVGGQYVAMAALGIIGNLTMDLVCYVWDTIQWSIDSIPYKHAQPPNAEKFTSIPMVQNSNHGRAFNHEARRGDYLIARYWNYQATSFYTNDKFLKSKYNIEWSKGIIDPIARSNNLYNDDGTFKNEENMRDQTATDVDLDLRVKNGLMRKKGNWYIWLNNMELMDNKGGKYQLSNRLDGEKDESGKWINPNPPETWYLDTHCNYSYLPTNLSKCLNSWSIRTPKPYYVTASRKSYFPDGDPHTKAPYFNSAISKYSPSLNANKMNDPNYRKYSMTRIFENAVTDMPLFDNKKYQATPIPIIQGIGSDSRNTLQDIQYATSNASLFSDVSKFKWNLSYFKHADFAFSGVQRIYKYGYFYNLWIDKGSSPANKISLPHIYEVRDTVTFPLLLDEPNLGDPPLFKLLERPGYDFTRKDVDRYNLEREKILRDNKERVKDNTTYNTTFGNVNNKQIWWSKLYPYPDTPDDYSYKNIYNLQRDEVFDENWLDVEVRQLRAKYDATNTKGWARYNKSQDWNKYGYKYPKTTIPNIKQFLNLDKDRKMFITLEGLHYIHTFLFHEFWTKTVMPDKIDSYVTKGPEPWHSQFITDHGENGRLNMSQGTLGLILDKQYQVRDSNNATAIIKEINKKPLETQVIVYRLVFELSCLKRTAQFPPKFTGFAGHRKLWGKQWCIKAAYLATVEFFIGNYNNLLFRHSFNHQDVFNTLYGFTGNPLKITGEALDKAVSLTVNSKILTLEVFNTAKKLRPMYGGGWKYDSDDGYVIYDIPDVLKKGSYYNNDEIAVLKEIVNMGFNDDELTFIVNSANMLHKNQQVTDAANEQLNEFDVTKLDVISFFNPENFKNMVSLTYMFRGNTFSYGFEDFHIILFNWNKAWKENPITRDLSFMFSDTDFLDVTNNNLSSLDVEYLKVDHLFGNIYDYESETAWRKTYKDNQKYIPQEWKVVDQNDEISRIYGKSNRPGYSFAGYLVSDDYGNIDTNLEYNKLYSDSREQIKYLYFNIPKNIVVNDDLFGALIEKLKYFRKLNTNLSKYWNKWVKKKARSGDFYWINPYYKLDRNGNNPTWINPYKVIDESKEFEKNIKYLNTKDVILWQEVFKDFKNFNLDISRWDMSSLPITLTDTYKNMFENTQVVDLKTLKIIVDKLIIANNVALKYFGLDKLDTSLITDMSGLFEHGRTTSIKDDNGVYLPLDTSEFNLDISAWDVSNVINMENMFKGCKSFNQDLSDWDLSNVVTTKGMFEDCISFNQDISNLDTSKVINMENMFKGTINLDKDIRNLNVESLIRYNNIFLDATKINNKYEISKTFNGYENDENFIKDENNGIIHYYLTDIEEKIDTTKREKTIKDYFRTYRNDLSITTVITLIAKNTIGIIINLNQLEDLFTEENTNEKDELKDPQVLVDFILEIEEEKRINKLTKYERILNKSLISENTDIDSIDLSLETFIESEKVIGLRMHEGHLQMKRRKGTAPIYLTKLKNIMGIDGGTIGRLLSKFDYEKKIQVVSGEVKSTISLNPNRNESSGKILFEIKEEWTTLTKKGTAKYLEVNNLLASEQSNKDNLFEVNYFIENNKDYVITGYNKWNTNNILDKLNQKIDPYQVWIEEETNFKKYIVDVKNDVFRTKYKFFKYKFNNKDELIYAINYYKLYGKMYKLVYGNMSNWNVSKISDLSYLFYEINGDFITRQKGLPFNEDLSEWDVSNAVNMSFMFYRCFNFNQDIGKWNVSNVTNMQEMFKYATIFNQDISTKEVTLDDGTTYIAWDVTNVRNMKKMFRGAYKFDRDIRKWNVRNADIYHMFRETSAFLFKFIKITQGRFEITGLYTRYDIDYTQNKHKYFIFENTINPEELRNMTDKYVDLFYD